MCSVTLTNECIIHVNYSQKVAFTFQVYNIIPSISAITGVSPQRYLWRVCVAFHVGPRIIIASMYHTYYQSLLSSQPPGTAHPDSRSCRLLNATYWLSLLEIAALCGVTYISNRENYRMYSKNASCLQLWSILFQQVINVNMYTIAQIRETTNVCIILRGEISLWLLETSRKWNDCTEDDKKVWKLSLQKKDYYMYIKM